MAATTFLVFYRFKSMNKEEAVKARTEWRELRNGLPDGIELIGEYDHAWGTEYNGFLLIESESSDKFLDWWSGFKDKVRWYVEQTHTIGSKKTIIIHYFSHPHTNVELEEPAFRLLF